MRVVRKRNSDGAAAIVISVCITVLFGSAAIVLDAGDIWQERRQLVSATDAAAVAAAQDEALGINGCEASAGVYVLANAPEAVLTSCVAAGSGSGGQVSVAAEVTVVHALAKVLGRDQTIVRASSTAQYGKPAALLGLRPFALCAEAPGFLAWQASSHSTTDIFRIYYGKTSPDDCGGPAPGNWGLIDYNGGANSNSELKNWVQNGYPGVVSAPNWNSGDPGAFSNTLPISNIVGTTIQLPIYDDYNESPGAGAQFNIVGFVSVRITGYNATGPDASRYLDVQFLTAVASGVCCDDGTTDTGLRVVTLCAVEETSSCS